MKTSQPTPQLDPALTEQEQAAKTQRVQAIQTQLGQDWFGVSRMFGMNAMTNAGTASGGFMTPTQGRM